MLSFRRNFYGLYGVNARTDLGKANEHHRKYLESLPSTSYPLKPTGDPVEVGEPQKVTDEPLAQR
jgi:hypothetical protein